MKPLEHSQAQAKYSPVRRNRNDSCERLCPREDAFVGHPLEGPAHVCKLAVGIRCKPQTAKLY